MDMMAPPGEEAQPGLMNAIAQAVQGVSAPTVQRDEPNVDESRKRLVSQWQNEIRLDKEYYKDTFKRMREDMQYAKDGAVKEWIDADNYTVPLINRHINLTVASLYAKNPKAQAKRKRKLKYQAWDGTKQSAEAAFQMAQAGDPMAQQILAEIVQSRTNDQMLDRLGKTLEIMFEYYTGENTPNFKQEMKQAVRRAKTCGVAYVELGFQRVLEESPEIVRQIDDMTQQISLIESKLADVQDKEVESDSAEVEELKTMLADLQNQKMIIAREGLTFNFPRSANVIPHRACKQLRGWVGADYITHEYNLTPEQIQQVYKVDVKGSYRVYKNGQAVTAGVETGTTPEGKEIGAEGTKTGKRGETALVWRVQSRRTGQVFTLVEGYPDFVEAPAAHELNVNGFYTIFALTFNDIEDERDIFPLSDVHYLKHPQREYNNARQSLREHRIANRPKYFMRKGALEETEKASLKSAPAHTVFELNALDGKVDDLIQGYKGVPIDPGLYDTSQIMKDVLFGVGSQDANLGATSGATATESSISEQSRSTSLSSNVDDLDEFLSDVARASGQIMLANVDVSTAKKIAGPGAVWPQLNPEEIAEELFLEVKAGSSGRPNKAAELANTERAMPYLIQLGGVSGTVLAKRYADLLDIDEEELIVEGLPSIVAMNAMASKAAAGAQPSTGDAQTDPAQQGAQGANNAPKAAGNEPGAQPEYTAPVHQYNAQGERL